MGVTALLGSPDLPDGLLLAVHQDSDERLVDARGYESYAVATLEELAYGRERTWGFDRSRDPLLRRAWSS